MFFDRLLVVLLFRVASLPLGRARENVRRARLAGGDAANSFEFPFMTVIHHRTMICSGAIVSDEWIMTAAHCFAHSHGFHLNASEVLVIAGLVNYDRRTEHTQVRLGAEIYIHPKFKVSSADGRGLKMSSGGGYLFGDPTFTGKAAR